MDWQQLKQNSCPGCGASLQAEIFSATYRCNKECGFKIGEEKFDKIMRDMTEGKFVVPDVDENLSGLNNL